MKKLFSLFISMAMCTIVFSQTPVSGNIIINTTWDLPGSPYQVTGDVTVDAGITLTIDAGVVVEFNNSRSLYTYGTINATSATFTSINVVPTIGDWNYMRFYSGSTTTFSGCNIEYGDYLDVAAGASLTINSGSIIENMYYYGIYNLGTVNFTNSTIDLTDYVTYGYGLYTDGTSITNVNTSTISDCQYGIFTIGTSTTNLNTVTISNCQSGAYINSEGSDIDFTNSTFSSNEWPVYIRYLGDITIGLGNNFSGNTRDAFYVYPATMSKNWTMPYTDVDVPYYFRTYFNVNNTYTLTIEEENIIKFPLNDGLRIYGKLVANAGLGQSIYFTSDRDDNWGGDTNNDGAATAPAVSNWEGIQFFDASDNTSVMRRCQIRYAGQGNIGGISLYDAGPIIEYCELQQNYFGAYFQYASNPTFNYNTVGSSTLTPIAMSFEANPSFIDNVLSFMDNQYDAIGLLGGTLTANAKCYPT
ncbi:MAG: right-handed parallel beta-helix repeat-containing protein [Bacteroidales bacterium]|nr:right-handed parallel beta-helix repeat-containing protein [Bacteroidales bacterium]